MPILKGRLFDFLSANYDFKNTVLDAHIKPYKVFVKNDIKIGVFGLGIELKGLVDPRMYKETVYNNPVAIAREMSRILNEEETCDLVICLSHLGYHYKKDENKICDLELAGKTKDIDFENMKRAIIYGSAMASFCVEKFGTDRLVGLTENDVKERVQEFIDLVQFEINLEE